VNSSAQNNHLICDQIERITLEQLQYARLEVGGEGGVWQLFAEDGEMKMYKREEEIDGVAVDPLKAVHTVKGVTGREMCHYFYSTDVRFEWESKSIHFILSIAMNYEFPNCLVRLQPLWNR